jgi:SOS-response transcriptional repressor LexA
METKHDRLKQARIARHFSSAARAADALGIPYGTYSGHESGARGFKDDEAQRYADFFRVSFGWLVAGEGFSIPQISWVSAGRLDVADQVVDMDGAKMIPLAGVGPGDWFALEVQGDSMDRISPPGSIIIVNRRDKRLVANGCYIIADGDGGATYKRYRSGPMRFEPVSTNTDHDTFFPDQEPTIIGRVRKTILDL